MESRNNVIGTTGRASPQNDAQVHRPTPVTSGLGLPCQVRTRLKTQVPIKIRFATWNIGTLTGRCRELADVLTRRRVQVAFLQETRWKGSKSRNIGQGYKLMYTGSLSGKNGVAIVLSENIQKSVLEVDRVSDRLMRVKVLVEGSIANLISAYTPQAGCSDSDKEAFWNDVEDMLHAIPNSESIFVGGDLNGHVGEVSQGYERVHGGYGYGQANAEGESILRTCAAADLCIVNTFFRKKTEHLITYKSGLSASQIDFLLMRRCHIGKVTNCKVIPGENLTSQHRILIMDLRIFPKRKVAETSRPRTKWWLLNGPKRQEFCQGIEDFDLQVPGDSPPEDQWRKIQSAFHFFLS